MIALMGDGMLRVREASALTWSAVRPLPDGTGRLKIDDKGDDSDYTMPSADTMSRLDPEASQKWCVEVEGVSR